MVEPAPIDTDELFANVTAFAGITATHQGSWRLFKDDFDTGYLGIGQAWGDYNNDGHPNSMSPAISPTVFFMKMTAPASSASHPLPAMSVYPTC